MITRSELLVAEFTSMYNLVVTIFIEQHENFSFQNFQRMVNSSAGGGTNTVRYTTCITNII